MALAHMHKEDIKAALRKRFGSVAAFERSRGLPEKSVTDLLRGYASARVEKAVVDAISGAVPDQSEVSDDNSTIAPAHRLNAQAR
ncbi:helix-turn-helix domain-containing protein [uncultured Sphingomonas sp.]|uniref:helix-turn-helix domain-containing protein n=1 Tax=uncultured Sphingomonas sp. TaxID=158754 RepID=UPI0025873FB6|nr:helix-turn-helix domain-containing protein [uncultured Sphingomonas sp.]